MLGLVRWDICNILVALFPITIIAHLFYRDTIIIMICIPSLYEQYININSGDTCMYVALKTELQHNVMANQCAKH